MKKFLSLSLAVIMTLPFLSNNSFATNNSNKKEIQIINETNLPKNERLIKGEFHTHSAQSNDASEKFMTFENQLNAAFRENINNLPKATRAFLDYGKPYDFLMTADHLRNSPRNIEGKDLRPQIPRYKGIEEQVKKYNDLKKAGKYANKIYYPGFEWDMMGMDHGAVAIIGNDPNKVPIEGIHEFEWKYSYDTKNNVFKDNEKEKFGPRKNDKKNKKMTYDAIKWLQENYPKSFLMINHPSRNNGKSNEIKIEDIRKLNDLAPNIVFSIEGIPGNLMNGDFDGNKEIFGGADVVIAKLGGIWDSLLGEGRRFFNFTNADFHFKISTNKKSSSGYWPSEFSSNYLFGKASNFNEIIDTMRSGNSFSVMGDLISDLKFNINQDEINAQMGGEINAKIGKKADIIIKFKESDFNNYKTIFGNIDKNVNNKPKVDHIDLIEGEVNGKVKDYSNKENKTTKVLARFNKKDFGQKDKDGYYTIKYKVTVDKNKYYRLRGTNLGTDVKDLTKNGEPLRSKAFDTKLFTNKEKYFDLINNRNYRSLWFYSNPIFLNAIENNNSKDDDSYDSENYDFDINNLELESPISFDYSLYKNDINNYTDKESVNLKNQNNKNNKNNLNPIDIKNHWAESIIKEIVSKNIMELINDKFMPDTSATRYTVIKALAKLENINNVNYQGKSMKDIQEGTEENVYINWSIKNNIIKGYPDGTFKPERKITREEMAVILNRYVENLNKNIKLGNAIKFLDEAEFPNWALNSIKKATQRNLLKGRNDNKFHGKDNISRAEVAQILKNILLKF